MRDVTAVVLSIGEPYTERALASLRRQTLTAAETIVVRDVSPFHCALNKGAAQVRTPFFLHVDADMVLDENCIAALRPLMTDRVGMVQGRLRDPRAERSPGFAWFAPRAGPRPRTPIRLRPNRFSLETSPGMAGGSSRRCGTRARTPRLGTLSGNTAPRTISSIPCRSSASTVRATATSGEPTS